MSTNGSFKKLGKSMPRRELLRRLEQVSRMLHIIMPEAIACPICGQVSCFKTSGFIQNSDCVVVSYICASCAQVSALAMYEPDYTLTAHSLSDEQLDITIETFQDEPDLIDLVVVLKAMKAMRKSQHN